MVVAPYVGAWIETCNQSISSLIAVSHPTWVRGLKLEEVHAHAEVRLSHPTWVRGLKHQCAQAGAALQGRTLRGCVD